MSGRRRLRPAGAAAVLTAAAFCGACAPADHRAEDEARLRAMHAAILQAHLDRDADAWTALEADTMFVGSRGRLFRAARADRLEGRRAYLAATRFSVYRDLQPPLVRVAGDRSIGWLAAEVEIAGLQRRQDGGEDSLHTFFAWIETYERRNGRWRMTGNVSTERP